MPVGERVVAYFDHIGGIEGAVVREFDGGFAFSIAATKHKREKLAAQLTWLANRSELGSEDGRRHERITPQERRADPAAGRRHRADLPGARRLDLGRVDRHPGPARSSAPRSSLGKLRARVMRHHPQGFGVQFLDIQNPTALRRYFG